jgi:hypothetical protein
MARSMTTTFPTASAAPRWAGDYGGRDNLMIGGFRADPAQFAKVDAVVVTVGAAGAAAGAVALPVDALTGPIPNNTEIMIGGTRVLLTADALGGAVALTVEALPRAFVDNETGTWPGLGVKALPSGSILGRTLAERDAGTAFGPAADADDEVFITYFANDDLDHVPDIEFYRPNMTVYENFLPVWASVSAAVKAKIRASYRCTIGSP